MAMKCLTGGLRTKAIFTAITGRLYPSLPLPAMPVTHNAIKVGQDTEVQQYDSLFTLG